jgi:2,4-dichlorophenol 6-monooxygenase
VAWRNKEGTSDVKDAADKLGAAIRTVLDLSNLSAIPRQKQADQSNPTGTPLFA